MKRKGNNSICLDLFSADVKFCILVFPFIRIMYLSASANQCDLAGGGVINSQGCPALSREFWNILEREGKTSELRNIKFNWADTKHKKSLKRHILCISALKSTDYLVNYFFARPLTLPSCRGGDPVHTAPRFASAPTGSSKTTASLFIVCFSEEPRNFSQHQTGISLCCVIFFNLFIFS